MFAVPAFCAPQAIAYEAKTEERKRDECFRYTAETNRDRESPKQADPPSPKKKRVASKVNQYSAWRQFG
jgi:hypothetical protein